MAARQLAKSKVNWVELHGATTKAQLEQYRAFKGKYDGYVAKVNALPTALPKIDWQYYQKAIPLPGIVDKFKKEYEALKVPEPKDQTNWKAKIDQEEKKYQDYVTKNITLQKEMVKSADLMLESLKTLPPYEEMMEELHYLYFYHGTHTVDMEHHKDKA